MKRFRSLVGLFVLLGLVLPLIAGCGGDTPAAEPVEAPSEATAAPAEPGKPFAGREITVMFIADKTWAPDIVREFGDATGAKVNVVLADYEEMQTKFTAAAAAKSGAFDVVSGDEAAWFMAGYLEPLDEYMKEIDQADVTGLDMRLYNGKRYGMPWLIDNRIFMYNESIIQQAGFDAPPKTWDELFEQAKAIKDQGILDYPIMFPWMQHMGEFCDMTAWFMSAGGQWFNADMTQSVVNSPENVQAIEFLKKLYDNDLVNPEALASKSYPVSQTLAQGNAAFGTTWVILTGMLDDPNESTVVGQVKAALYPGISEGVTGTYDGSESLAIAADSQDKELAWEFIKWMTGKEVEKKVFLQHKILPIWKSLYDDPELVAAAPNLPTINQQRQSILFLPNEDWSGELSLAIQVAALEAILGTTPTQDALDTAAETIDGLLGAPVTAIKPVELPSLAGREITVMFIADKTWAPDIVREFGDATGAKVNVVLADYEEMQTKFTAAAAAKSGAFDVVSGDEAAWFMAGYLEPLDEYMKEIDQADVTGLDMRLYNGKRYGMPWLIDNRIFMYNESIIQQAGFDAPPKTWDELFEQAKAIKDQGILDYPIMFPWMQHMGEFCDMTAWFMSAGGQWFNADMTQSVVNSPENVQAIEFLKKLYDNDLVNPEALASKSYPVSQTLAQGNAAFGTTWVILTGMLDDPNESTVVGQVKAALYPGISEGVTGTYDGSESLAIAADSQDKEAAWEFIKWMTGKEVEKQVFMQHKILPIWKSLYDDPELTAAAPNLPIINQQRQSILFLPNEVWSSEFSLAIQIAALEAITGASSAQEALDAASTTIDELINP